MAYGFRTTRKSSSSSYRRRFGGFGRFASAKARGRRVAFTRRGFIKKSGEKKYWDKTYQSNSQEALTGNSNPVAPNTFSRGVTYYSDQWGTYTFGTLASSSNSVSNDMLKGLDTGTTARARVGNKIKMNYAKGAFTFTAATVFTGAGGIEDQNGEAVAALNTQVDSEDAYLRTTFRFAIVKDLQVNSADAQVTWAQVFDTTGMQAGVHSELNVDNMGRFIVLEDKIFTVDGQNPQKTIPFMVRGNSIGSVRYNGSTGAALTDKGLYVVWAAFVMGYTSVLTTAVTLPSPVGHSRVCFTDE